MKSVALLAACLYAANIHSIEYEVKFENDLVHVSKAKVMPNEEIGAHRDELPRVVIALQGGTITRLEADGTTNDVKFPTGEPVFLEMDPPNELHKAVNNSDSPVELIVIQLKK
jgi:hypothetical protein